MLEQRLFVRKCKKVNLRERKTKFGMCRSLPMLSKYNSKEG
jgi:hypothetical protein